MKNADSIFHEAKTGRAAECAIVHALEIRSYLVFFSYILQSPRLFPFCGRILLS